MLQHGISEANSTYKFSSRAIIYNLLRLSNEGVRIMPLCYISYKLFLDAFLGLHRFWLNGVPRAQL